MIIFCFLFIFGFFIVVRLGFDDFFEEVDTFTGDITFSALLNFDNNGTVQEAFFAFPEPTLHPSYLAEKRSLQWPVDVDAISFEVRIIEGKSNSMVWLLLFFCLLLKKIC